MSDSKGLGAGLLATGCAPLAVFAGCLMMLVLMVSPGDGCVPGGGGPGVVIDTDSLPDGPVAGYHTEQLLNAAYIINAGAALDLDARDQKIGVMTAMGESSLRVLDEGDAAGEELVARGEIEEGSRGLFQQLGNGAWGSHEDRMDPTISATNFFLALMEVDEDEAIGDEDVVARQMSLIAHAVQVNADPYHYEAYWQAAEDVFNALAGIDLPGVPDDYSASPTCTISGGGAPQISDQCAPVASPNLQSSTCRGYAAIQAEFSIEWPGGVGCYDPRPWEDPPMDHPKGLACDYMVATAAQGKIPTPEMHQQTIEVINWLIQHHEVLKIKYVIYEGHIWNPGYGDPVGSWETVKRASYLYATGDLTTDHYDHIHVSHYP